MIGKGKRGRLAACRPTNRLGCLDCAPVGRLDRGEIVFLQVDARRETVARFVTVKRVVRADGCWQGKGLPSLMICFDEDTEFLSVPAAIQANLTERSNGRRKAPMMGPAAALLQEIRRDVLPPPAALAGQTLSSLQSKLARWAAGFRSRPTDGERE